MKGNCTGCNYLQTPKPIEIVLGEEERYYCKKHFKWLTYRYTDEEFPLVEKCEECKGGECDG